MTVGSDSKIVFRRLKRSLLPNEIGETIIVRWDTDKSLAVDKDVVEIISLFSHGLTVNEVSQKTGYLQTDIKTLIHDLAQNNFVKEIDGTKLPDESAKIKPWLANISQKWFSWTIFKPFLSLLFVFVLCGLFLGLTTTGYFPTYKSFFWTDDLFIVILSLFLFDAILVTLHELGHFIATKAVGGEASIRLSTRFFHIVAETQSFHLAVIPKTLRYFVYFAGMFVDFFIIALVYWMFRTTEYLHLDLGIYQKIMMVVVLIEIKSIVWQFNISLETDMYNFLSDFLDKEYLKPDTQKMLGLRIKNWKTPSLDSLKKVLLKILLRQKSHNETDDLRGFTKKTKKLLIIYSVILVVGFVFISLQYFFFIIPRDLVFLGNSFRGLLGAFNNYSFYEFLKWLIIIVLITYQYALLIYLKISPRRSKGI